MSTIIGHEWQREYLNKVFARERMAHAYIFSGPEHVGKLTIAKKFAKSFFCARAREGKKIFENVCERCVSCVQIEKNQNKNFFFLDTEHTLTSAKEIRKDIPIDDIRELKHQYSLRSGDGEWRIVIINDAEKLNDYAVNAFLKLLEEPSEQSLFILITADEELLMPTILSRASRMRFGLVAEEKLAFYARAQGFNEARARAAARLARKRPGVFVRLCQDNDFFEATERKAVFMDRMLRSSISDIVRAAEKIAEDPAARQDALWFLFAALHNAFIPLEITPGSVRDKTSDGTDRSLPLKTSLPTGREFLTGFILKATNGDLVSFLDSIKKIDRMRHLLETTNVNPRLALEALFIEAKRVYSKNGIQQ